MKNVLQQSYAKVLLNVCFLFVFNFLSIASTLEGTETDKKDIPLRGEWEEGKRSISIECPVSVSWDGICLYIESLSSRSEIQVTLFNGTEVICNETILAGFCPATIYVGTLVLGKEYQLVLTNQFGDRLEGIF